MSDDTKLTVRAHTIGQTPRPDLTEQFMARMSPVSVEVRGALDGLAPDEIPPCPDAGYPLETRLRDGQRVVVDAAWLEPRIQDSISAGDHPATMHFVLCAGFFPHLESVGRLIQPFEVATNHLIREGIGSIEVIVPFAAQAGPALRKWETAGFSCRVEVMGEDADSARRASQLATLATLTESEAIVFDYVGLRGTVFQAVDELAEVPVFDVGRVGLEALEDEVRSEREPCDG